MLALGDDSRVRALVPFEYTGEDILRWRRELLTVEMRRVRCDRTLLSLCIDFL
jgi:hypothetical protein